MSVNDRFRSGDTVPPNVLGENRAVDEALAELTQGLEPDEDALYARPGWSERADVKLTKPGERTTQEMDVRDIQAGRLASGANEPTPAPARPSPELAALQKKQLITIRTRTVGNTPSDYAEDEFIDVSTNRREDLGPDSEDLAVASPRRWEGWEGRWAIIGVALAALIFVLGGLVFRKASGAQGSAKPADEAPSSAPRIVPPTPSSTAARPEPPEAETPPETASASPSGASTATPPPSAVVPPPPATPPKKVQPASKAVPPPTPPKSSAPTPATKPGGLEPIWD
ncbi:MAG: hypothetical protein AB7S68_23860 [Polyangiaceae bacterium]